jgi:hypothetical protein
MVLSVWLRHLGAPQRHVADGLAELSDVSSLVPNCMPVSQKPPEAVQICICLRSTECTAMEGHRSHLISLMGFAARFNIASGVQEWHLF